MRHKCIALLALVMLCSLNSEAQLNLGIRGEGLVSRTDYDVRISQDTLTQMPRLGFAGGILAEYRMTELFHARTEINYSFRGRTIRNPEFDLRNQQRHQFISVPLMVGMSWGANPSYFYVQGGPNISYWLSGYGRLTGDELEELSLEEIRYRYEFGPYPDADVKEDVVYTNEVNRIQYGLDLAMGMRFDLRNKQQIAAELRLTLVQSNLGESFGEMLTIASLHDHLNASYQVLGFSVSYFLDLETSTRKKGKSTLDLK